MKDPESFYDVAIVQDEDDEHSGSCFRFSLDGVECLDCNQSMTIEHVTLGRVRNHSFLEMSPCFYSRCMDPREVPVPASDKDRLLQELPQAESLRSMGDLDTAKTLQEANTQSCNQAALRKTRSLPPSDADINRNRALQ